MSLRKHLEIIILIILITVFVLQCYWFYFLSDDSFISFRYAKNLALGHGLVWNPGYYIEGYTNFLWTMIMALVIYLGLAPELWSNSFSIFCAIVLLYGITQLSKTLTKNRYIYLLPMALCATSRSFCAWSTSGLETMLFATLLFFASRYFLKAYVEDQVSIIASFLFAALCLCRPEGALFTGLAGVFLLVGLFRKKIQLKALVTWLTPLLIIVGSHSIWRIWYYGELLPNTFYAKVPGLWLEQGLKYLKLFHSDYQLGWLLPILIIVPLLKRSASYILFSLICSFQIIYIILIGGDRFEFRFLVPILPFYFILTAIFFDQLLCRTKSKYIRLSFCLCILSTVFLSLYGSHKPQARVQRHGIASIQGVRRYAQKRSNEGKFLQQLVKENLLPADTIIAVGGAGALPYYSGLPTVDRRGLSDHFIARLPIEKRGIIAHERDAPLSYLQERKVVIFDLLNQIVHNKYKRKYVDRTMKHLGTDLKLYTYKVKDKYLVFAGVLEDQEIDKSMNKLEKVNRS